MLSPIRELLLQQYRFINVEAFLNSPYFQLPKSRQTGRIFSDLLRKQILLDREPVRVSQWSVIESKVPEKVTAVFDSLAMGACEAARCLISADDLIAYLGQRPKSQTLMKKYLSLCSQVGGVEERRDLLREYASQVSQTGHLLRDGDLFRALFRLGLAGEYMTSLKQNGSNEVLIASLNGCLDHGDVDKSLFGGDMDAFIKSGFHKNAYDIVVDVSNVAYALRDHTTGYRTISNPETVSAICTSLLQRFNLILFVCKDHLRSIDFTRVSFSTGCLKYQSIDTFNTNNRSLDDIFILYACMHERKSNVHFVTYDRFRDHMDRLDCPDLFRRWCLTNQCFMIRSKWTNNTFRIIEPSIHEPRVYDIGDLSKRWNYLIPRFNTHLPTFEITPRKWIHVYA
ncbi:hypothetical protein ACOME3_007994 [Neoechinorhynchus agilis]